MDRNGAIDTIIFDAGGILFYINEFRNSIMERVLFSLGYDELIVKKAIDSGKLFDKHYFSVHDDICTWDDEKKWLEARSSIIANVVDDGNLELADRLKYLAFDTFQYQLFDETVDVLRRLRCKYNLSVLSNATASLDWAFDNLDIRQYFDEVIISAYEKCVKPNEKLYQIALERLKKNSNQCVFIDDKVENVEAAIKLGIKGYHLDRGTGQTLLDFESFLNEQNV
jgi:HAD superfamily hydrolase (TIGR01509 family)